MAVSGKKEGFVLDRLLKRYLWVELLLGIAVLGLGIVFGGATLFLLGGAMIGFSAQCAAHAQRFRMGAAVFGVLALAVLVIGCLRAFSLTVSLTGYESASSPLSVLLVVALIILVQCFLTLPVEDRPDLGMVHHGLKVLAIFSGLGLLGIVLNYVLSYVMMDLFADNLVAWEEYLASGTGAAPASLQDFHYLEGVLALAVGMTAIRAVVRAYMGKEPLEDEKEIVAE